MSEERYDIKEKLGQGGVGAVYRAHDNNLNREVAIKRVLPAEDFTKQEGSTEGLIQEAKALSSINHPHIVSVYDAGVDKDGPYVIMELLDGKTFDEVIEKSSLTLEDFREVAIQSQEALIAAQDLDIVHRDLKPGNVMLVWLPSGKFQLKLLDFGLAKFTPKPSLQTIDNGDAVMGSIHFMAPEQFERTPLDKRTDMYAIGCVYYYALTGKHPFEGETAPQVMTAHLQHTVVDLAEYRPDLPGWLCQWIMWHLNHNMDDRPEGARRALEHFLTCESDPDAPLPFTVVSADGTRSDAPNKTSAKKGPRLLVPGADKPDPEEKPAVAPITASQHIESPDPSRPSVHTTAQKVKTARLEKAQRETGSVPTQKTNPTPPRSGTTPVNTQGKANGNSAGQTGTPPPVSNASSTTKPPGTLGKPAKKGLGSTGKAVIAAGLAVLVILGGIIYFQRLGENRRIEALNVAIAPLQSGPVEEIPLDGKQVKILLEAASGTGADSERATYFTALQVGKSSDGTDIDLKITEFATSQSMSDEIRKNLFQVIARRGNEVALPLLIDYAKTGGPAAPQALAAARNMATPANFGDLLAIINDSAGDNIRRVAERTLGDAISKSGKPAEFDGKLVQAYQQATQEDRRAAYLRLMGLTGGTQSFAIIKKSLEKKELTTQVAALNALSNWPDRSQAEILLDFTRGTENDTLRSEAFNALMELAKNTPDSADYSDKKLLTAIFDLASQSNEKLRVINRLASSKAPWALPLLKTYETGNQADDVIYRAEKAVRYLENSLQNKG